MTRRGAEVARRAHNSEVDGANPSAATSVVIGHPSRRRIPPCKLPLATTEGQKEYDTYARMLFDAGKLDASRHMSLSLYASAMDEIARRTVAKEPIRGSFYETARKSFAKLGLDDLTNPIAEPEDRAPSKFARAGFSSRSR